MRSMLPCMTSTSTIGAGVSIRSTRASSARCSRFTLPSLVVLPGLNDEAFVEHLAKRAVESFGTVDVVARARRCSGWPVDARGFLN